MVGKKLVVARDAGWGCDPDGQPGFEFSRVIDRSRDTLGRPLVFIHKQENREICYSGREPGGATNKQISCQ